MKNELKEILKSSSKIDLIQYRAIASLFQKYVVDLVSDIWLKNNNQIIMELNDVPICLEGSAVNSSTAFGFIIEEFLVRQLPMNEFKTLTESTVNSVYDFKFFDDSKIELLVNLKVERATNNGVCAAKILMDYYNRNTKPKLYLILKSKYLIDSQNSNVLFDGIQSYYLESFITNEYLIKSDSRNWSTSFNILSGRLQSPNKNVMKNLGIDDIPSPDSVLRFINNDLEKALIRSKDK
tara:strand:+ start:1058 stop:1768 length:711 start_codon:yes stop_codon:yes gene_type:complete